MGELIWIIVEKWVNRMTARRRATEWLQHLDSAQKQLLGSALRAAKASRLRIVEWRSERAEPAQFEAQCALLLSTRAVTASKYPSPGTRRYRFEPWLFDYLSTHPELLELRDDSGDGAGPDSAQVEVGAGMPTSATG